MKASSFHNAVFTLTAAYGEALDETDAARVHVTNAARALLVALHARGEVKPGDPEAVALALAIGVQSP